jgi:two-component system, chemotaxis family, chemotaxis protein CheY
MVRGLGSGPFASGPAGSTRLGAAADERGDRGGVLARTVRRLSLEGNRTERGNTMGKRILVVDDSPSIRQQVTAALQGGGFEILEAGDGVEAFETLAAQQDIAAVICDVNMPRMNGLELLEKLQTAGAMTRLAVVMLTTEAQPALLQRAKAAGAKGWIVKPFKAPLLLAAIKKMTGQ